jgi:hypothetical protein
MEWYREHAKQSGFPGNLDHPASNIDQMTKGLLYIFVQCALQPFKMNTEEHKESASIFFSSMVYQFLKYMPCYEHPTENILY